MNEKLFEAIARIPPNKQLGTEPFDDDLYPYVYACLLLSEIPALVDCPHALYDPFVDEERPADASDALTALYDYADSTSQPRDQVAVDLADAYLKHHHVHVSAAQRLDALPSAMRERTREYLDVARLQATIEREPDARSDNLRARLALADPRIINNIEVTLEQYGARYREAKRELDEALLELIGAVLTAAGTMHRDDIARCAGVHKQTVTRTLGHTL